MDQNLKVLLVGVGNMGSAMVKAWLRSSTLDSSNIILLDTDPSKLHELKFASEADSISARAASADVIVLAIKPQDLDAAAASLTSIISDKSIILSILAGVSLSKLSNRFAKNKKIIRAMPNIGARICQSMTAFVASDDVSEMDAEKAIKLLKALGPVERLSSEILMDSWCAIAGSGPGFVVALIESFVEAAIEQGFPKGLAEQIVKQTFFGTVSLLHESKGQLEETRASVTSKGGTTAAGLSVFEAKNLSGIIKEIVQAAADRGRELNRDAC